MSEPWVQQNKPKNRFVIVFLLSIVYGLLISNIRLLDVIYLGEELIDRFALVSLSIAHILLFMSLFGTNERARNAFLALGSVSLAYTAFPIFPDFYSGGEISKFFGTDAWSIAVLQVLGLILFVSALILGRRGFKVLRDHVRLFFSSLTQIGNRVIGLVLLLGLALLFAGIVYDLADSFSRANQEEIEYSRYFYDQFQLILFSVLSFIVAFFGIALLSPMLVKLVKGLKAWWQITTDFSITKYLTRRISASFFTFTYYLSAALITLILPAYIFVYLDLGSVITFIGYLGAILVYPIALAFALAFWILLVVTLRLIYEITNAIIHVAENTTRDNI